MKQTPQHHPISRAIQQFEVLGRWSFFHASESDIGRKNQHACDRQFHIATPPSLAVKMQDPSVPPCTSKLLVYIFVLLITPREKSHSQNQKVKPSNICLWNKPGRSTLASLSAKLQELGTKTAELYTFPYSRAPWECEWHVMDQMFTNGTH